MTENNLYTLGYSFKIEGKEEDVQNFCNEINEQIIELIAKAKMEGKCKIDIQNPGKLMKALPDNVLDSEGGPSL